jgi:hypothetical protein
LTNEELNELEREAIANLDPFKEIYATDGNAERTLTDYMKEQKAKFHETVVAAAARKSGTSAAGISTTQSSLGEQNV